MNIIFLGSSHFGEPSLRALVSSGHKISCVVTQPDRARGRGLIVSPTVIKETALELGLKIFQPPSVNSPSAIKSLKDLKAGLFIVISYGQILSQELLDIPKAFTINAHASLLPEYRGAAPINWAIIRGEKITGVTIMKVTRRLDSGPVILQEKAKINEDDNAPDVEERLSIVAARLIPECVDAISSNSYKLKPQDEAKAGFAPKLKKDDGLIDWKKPALEIHNLVRGCVPWPSAFTHYKGKLLKIHKTQVCPGPAGSSGSAVSCGEILEASKAGIVVAAAKGRLIIRELQIEGKRPMRVKDFISGHKVSVGESLS